MFELFAQLVYSVVQNDAIPDKRGLFDSFLKSFESKLNPVSLVQIVVCIVRAELHSSPKEALEFLKPLATPEDSKTRSSLAESVEANILLESTFSKLHMAAGDRAASKKSIENARQLVDSSQDVQSAVHSSFYEAAAEYHKVVGTASEFFRNALQYLAYTPPDSLSPDVQRRWAFDIGIAALVGADVYNFGEVVSRAIVQGLRGTEQEWLLLLLEAFNNGDLDKFERVCTQASAKMNAQQVLVAQQEFLKQKITILALLELAFSQSLHHSLSFSEIEKSCRLPHNEVEHLLMRCMSLGLVSGVIDNVDEQVSITRVQPRVLGREPIRLMAERLGTWCTNVDSTVSFLKETGVGVIE